MPDIQPTVFVVDDDEAITQQIGELVNTVGLNVRTFPSAKDFLNSYDTAARGCLVSDVRMPGLSGFELHTQLMEMNSPLPVIFITAYAEVAMAVEAMKNGAFDFIEKPIRNQGLVERIQGAITADGERRRMHMEKAQIDAKLNKLTPRESQIMEELLAGKTNKIIAKELGISTKTVDFHRGRIMAKMRVNSMLRLTTQIVKVRARQGEM